MRGLTILALAVVLPLSAGCVSREAEADPETIAGGAADDGTAAQAAGDGESGSQATGSSGKSTSAPEAIGKSQAEGGRGTVAELCAEGAVPADRIVRMSGIYHGFIVEGCAFPECAARVSSSRSDWLFRTGGDCVYVTGGAPPGVDPINPAFTGRRVDLTARAAPDPDGKLRLHYIEARLLED